MRMWMCSPSILCRNHLLGQHVELHMLLGSLRRGKSITGHLERGQIEPRLLFAYHKKVASEMMRRGYNHDSPINAWDIPPHPHYGPYVDRDAALADLLGRCPECRMRYEEIRRRDVPAPV